MFASTRGFKLMLPFVAIIGILVSPAAGYPPPACEDCACYESDLVYIGSTNGEFFGYRQIFLDESHIEVISAFYLSDVNTKNRADTCGQSEPYQNSIGNYAFFRYDNGSKSCTPSDNLYSIIKAERLSNSTPVENIRGQRAIYLCGAN
jgi:hypothetical protein